MDRIDLKLLVDFTERILLASEALACLRECSLRRGASQSGKGPDIMGRCGAGFAFFFVAPVSQASQLKLCFSSEVSGSGLVSVVLREVDHSEGSESSSSSSSSKCIVGISRNFTDGVARPVLVFIEALDERIDRAGAGLDDTEDIEPDRRRL